MTRSGGTSASTTVCTWLLRTCGTYATVGRQQTPATMHAHLLNRLQYCIATDLIQAIGSLIHEFRRESRTRRIYFQDRSSRDIVHAVDGTGFAAVQMVSVASEGDQVNH